MPAVAKTTEAPPAPRFRQRSLIAAILRAAALRIAGNRIDVDDSALVTALANIGVKLDHPALTVRGLPPTTIEDLLRQAVRLGVEAGLDWWTAKPSSSPYAAIENAGQVVEAVITDALPELLTRYYMIEKADSKKE